MGQHARPDQRQAIISFTWTPIGAIGYAEAVNEVVPDDDSSYDRRQDSNGSMEMTITVLSPPVIGRHIMRARCRMAAGAAGFTLALRVGAAGPIVASRAQASITAAYATYSYQLSDAEVALITSYSDLRLIFSTTGMDPGDEMRVTWMEMEVTQAAVRGADESSLATRAVTLADLPGLRLSLSSIAPGASLGPRAPAAAVAALPPRADEGQP